MTTLYNQEFYNEEGSAALAASEIIMSYVLSKLECRSVVDFGCGTGEWLNACKKISDGKINTVLGLDGEYVEEFLVLNRNEFYATDLTSDIQLNLKFDLAISLEVAEHLPQKYARQFVQNIVRHSDIVLFSAAVPYQSGMAHVNEQYPSYWEKVFTEFGYVVCDCIRKRFWNDKRIPFYYRQNILFFVKKGLESEIKKLFNYDDEALDIVHPELFEECMVNRQFIFPFEEVNHNSRIVIWGAGTIGKTFVNQLLTTGFAEIVLWCDTSYEQYFATDMPVKSPERLSEMDFDFVVIAVKQQSVAEEIKEQLWSFNVPSRKIIWRNANLVTKF